MRIVSYLSVLIASK